MSQDASRTEPKSLPLEASSERATDKVLDDAVRRGERWMSICRILFALASFATVTTGNWFWNGNRPSVRGWLTISLGACCIAFSLWLIGRTLRGPIPRWILGLSVTVDAIMCFMALLGNAQWPSPTYLGNFKSLHCAALVLVIAISGFRLSLLVVWLSVGLNTLSAVTLRYVDTLVLGTAVTFGFWPRLAIYLASAAALALIVARQTRTLVVAGAHDSLRAHRAQQALGTLLQDHHDVRSLLSSANLNAESLRRGLEEDHSQKANLECLRQDLRAVSALVSTLRERALQELTSAGGHLWADPARTVQAVIPLVSRRFPRVRIETDVPNDLRVLMAGGATVLERVLLNLLVNACEGDGTRGAASIWVHARRIDGMVHIRVEDDGPGFSDSTLRAPLAHTATSKSEGSGLGLFLVHGLVSASEGSLTLGKRPGGGARVEIVLRATAP
jgi:signal transduction histidine kinase